MFDRAFNLPHLFCPHDSVIRLSELTLEDLYQLKMWANTCLQNLRRHQAWDGTSRRTLEHLSQKILSDFPDEHHAFIAKALGSVQAAGLLETHDGFKKVLWFLLRKNYPECATEEHGDSIENICSVGKDLGQADKAKVLALAFGLSDLTSSTPDPLAELMVEDEEGQSRLDWPCVCKLLAQVYGWMPQQVLQLTLSQVRIYLKPMKMDSK